MIKFICKNCGKEFFDYKCHSYRKYCSLKCSNTSFKKGQTPWNKGQKGVMPIPWNKGIKSCVKPWLGKKLPLYIRKKISKAHEGKIPWNKGLKDWLLQTRHGNWQGGKSFQGYHLSWKESLREEVRKRDGYKCQECKIPQAECLTKLDVHHKDNNKKNCSMDNLISLCHKCHSKITVKEREVHRCKIVI